MAETLTSRMRPALRFPERARPTRDRAMTVPAPQPAEAAFEQRITVAVVHHSEIVREGLSLLLAQERDVVVVASCGGDLVALRAELARTVPNVVLLSFGLNPDGAAMAAAVADSAPTARLVVIGLPSAQADLSGYVHAGVDGFVLDQAGPQELLVTVRSVASGTRVWPPAIAQALFQRASRDDASRQPASIGSARMTRREREVVALIADGLSTKEIARRLAIASFTVRAHVRNIMGKLDMHTRLQIAAYVHRERATQGAGASLGSIALNGAQ